MARRLQMARRLHMARRNQSGLQSVGRASFARSSVNFAGDLVGDAYLLVLLAEQAIRAGRDEQAREWFEQAAAADPDGETDAADRVHADSGARRTGDPDHAGVADRHVTIPMAQALRSVMAMRKT